MRYINGFIMVAVVVMVCTQFAFAEVDESYGRPLIPDAQERADAAWPDGERRPGPGVILSDEWVNIITHGGLIRQRSPIWSPDSRYIYFVGVTDCGPIWRVDVESGEPERVTVFREIYNDLEIFNPHPFDALYGFINDGKTLLVGTSVIDEEWGTSVSLDYDDDGNLMGVSVSHARKVVMAVDVETGEQEPYLWDVDYMVCSQQGKYIAYRNSDAVTVIRNTVTDEEWIVEGVLLYGIRIYENEGFITYFDDNVKYRIPIEGGEAVIDSGHEPPCYISGVSPDGEWIAGTFNAGRRSGKHYDENGDEIGSWSSSSFDKLRLWNSVSDESIDPFPYEDNVECMNPSFSPDGSKVCYIRDDRDCQRSVYETYILDFDPSTMKDFPVAVADESPALFALLGNYPNPFNPTTTIGFALGEPGSVSLTVFSVTGQAIRELVSGQMAPGRHSVVWDGRDNMGNQVAAGVYISRLVAGEQSVSGRMTLVK